MVRRTAIAGMLMILTSACASSPNQVRHIGVLSSSPLPSTLHLTLNGWRNGDDGMLALIAGRLIVGPDGCVGLETPDGKRRNVVRWPAGTHFSDDGGGVVGPSGAKLAFGRFVSLGGGYGGVKRPSYCSATFWLPTTIEVQEPL